MIMVYVSLGNMVKNKTIIGLKYRKLILLLLFVLVKNKTIIGLKFRKELIKP